MLVERFGRLKSREITEIITIGNECATLKILTYGARIHSFWAHGVNIIGGYEHISEYEKDDSYQGAIVGRVANRIKDAEFCMDGAVYMLTDNDGGNCLHGGDGFSSHLWYIDEEGDNYVTLGYTSLDGEDGFPAGVEVKVKYTLIGATVIIEYSAIPDGKTPISLTNHSYFNLDGFGKTIDNHIATIYADRYTEVGEGLIPTGNRPLVAGTAFDFRQPKKIGENFGAEVDGYDHNFVLCPEIYKDFAENKLHLAASVTNGELELCVYTDQPGVQFYTGNFLGGKPDFAEGIARIKHGAFCLEAQTEPNSVNSGVGIYDAGEEYKQITVYEIKKVGK